MTITISGCATEAEAQYFSALACEWQAIRHAEENGNFRSATSLRRDYSDRLRAGMRSAAKASEVEKARRDGWVYSAAMSALEPKGHMAELADGWMPKWVKVPT